MEGKGEKEREWKEGKKTGWEERKERTETKGEEKGRAKEQMEVKEREGKSEYSTQLIDLVLASYLPDLQSTVRKKVAAGKC